MPPSLPVALAILAILGAPALAAPAPAAPDFEPMLVCSPNAHKYFGKATKAKDWAPEKIAGALGAFASILDGATSLTDEAAWSLKNDTSLPTGCRIGEPKVKAGVYAALSELRREINEKAGPVLEDDKRTEAADLTAKERSLDALMGAESQSVAEFKTKLNGLGIAGGSGAAIPDKPTRAEMLAIRFGDISARVQEAEKSGAGLPGANIPDAVKEREAKAAAEAKKRADAAKGLSFGHEKTDDTPNAGAGTAARGGQAGSGSPSGVVSPAVKKTPRPRVDSVAGANIDHDDPDEPSIGGAAKTIKNAATKPLGGAVNPPAQSEAENYEARKEAIKAKTLRLRKGHGMENDEEDMAFRSDLPFRMVGAVKNGNGIVTLVSPSGKPLKQVRIENGKPVVKPGELTAVEAGFIEGELE